MSKDFRYRMSDGSIVEAFQITPATRYQENLWPSWMNSKWLMTVDNQEWLNINDVETEIPKFGWIVKRENGVIGVVDYSTMESADKVVKETPVVHPPAKVDEDALLELGAKLTGKSVDELRNEQLRKGRVARTPPPEDSPPVEEVTGQIRNMERIVDTPTDIVLELCDAYEDLVDGKVDTARVKFRNILSQRVAWCQCPPGQCAGLDPLICRVNSPLTR
jgi:hypothetical protein